MDNQINYDELGILDRYFAAALQGAIASRLTGWSHDELVRACFEVAAEGVRQRREIYAEALERAQKAREAEFSR